MNLNLCFDRVWLLLLLTLLPYNTNMNISNDLTWQKDYDNPVEMADIIGVFIDNKDLYNINMWISIDKNILINVTKNNVNDLICYLYERFPY